jgi:hypothetical protein
LFGRVTPASLGKQRERVELGDIDNGRVAQLHVDQACDGTAVLLRPKRGSSQ